MGRKDDCREPIEYKDKKIFILGAGSLGLLALDILLSNNLYRENEIILLDDRTEIIGTEKHGVPISGPLDEVIGSLQGDKHEYIISIGDNASREKVHGRFSHLNYINLIHPKAEISQFAAFGVGNIFLPGAVVDPDSTIGNHVVVNKLASISHQAVLDDFSQIAPGAKITGHIGRKAFIGMGAVVLPGVSVGENSIIGAGSVVTKDIPPYCKAVGSPAKIISYEIKND